MIDDDPVLGPYIDHHPSDRLRLLIVGGAVLGVVWFVVTVALWQVEAGLAAALTVGVIALATLLVGWWIMHLWNREVILYARGFTYREGSEDVALLYAEIARLRQRAERLRLFGGLLRYTRYRIDAVTIRGEPIVLDRLYRRMEELGPRLENAVTQARLPQVTNQIEAGERVPFAESLALSTDGLHSGDLVLSWESLGGFGVEARQLLLRTRDGTLWHALPLREVNNVQMLLVLLKRYGE